MRSVGKSPFLRNHYSVLSNIIQKRIQPIINIPASILSSNRPLVLDLNLIATNKCTQKCPMCNSGLLYQENPATITLKEFKRFERLLRPYLIPTCTISGGEPTIAPDMPQILEYAKKSFPLGVQILTNLYGSTTRIKRVMGSALRNNVNISVSFDGFGNVADQLRNARNVSDRVVSHIKMVSEMRKELRSSSALNIHTVLSDLNLHQLPEIVAFSKELGWAQSVAPVNHFFYLPQDDTIPKLSYSRDLIDVCNLLLKQPHLTQLHAFIRGIPDYACSRAPKYCPYLSRILKTFKLFLEPNGDISLCDRVSIGNLLDMPLFNMFQGPIYEERIRNFSECQGCWLACFDEQYLAVKPANLVRLDFLNRRPKDYKL
ncbi:MAG: radical SAM protein [Candidatus Hodarchaeota archaeon]